MSLTSVQQTAYNDIQSRLEDGVFSGVDEGDLNAVRDTLSRLGATDADAVIDAMADTGLLAKLAEESNEGELLGMGQDGFSADERRDLFVDLASKLDGHSLAAVSNAFAEAETGHADFSVVTELADAVATHATPQAKVDYIGALSGSTGGEGIRDTYLTGGSGTLHVDSEAGAIGTVLSSLSGSHAEAAFAKLSDEALADVLQTGVEQFQTNSGATFNSSFDSGRFEGVLNAAATSGSAELKARVFNLAGERLGAVSEAGDGPTVFADNETALRGMTGAMTRLLDTDTTGVMRQLTYGTDPAGNAMTNYAEVMIATGQTESLSETMIDLQFGNAHDQNAVAWLKEEVTLPNGEKTLANANALGYFVGAVYAGAEDHSSDVKQQQDAVTGFLNFTLGKIPLGGGYNAGDVSLGQDLVKNAVQDMINDPSLDPAQRLEQSALPEFADGSQAVGDDIFSAFGDRLDSVRRQQAG